jgi:hypothetical protein
VNPNADSGVGIVTAALLATVVSADSDTTTAATATAATGAAIAALNLDLIPHLRSLERTGGDTTLARLAGRADLRKI